MSRYLKNYSTVQTTQSEAIPGRTDMRENNAGGYAWAVDDWMLMQRFLILGSEGGTYYVGEKKLTKDACYATMRCIKADGLRAVELIKTISYEGRAAKNDYALFALGMAAGEGNTATRKAAFDALPDVARIGTHLFHFAGYMEQFRGWGRLAREAVARWYNDMLADKLTYQVVKYQQRDGWSHKDMLRLSHPKAVDEDHDMIYKYIVNDYESIETKDRARLWVINGFEGAKTTTDKDSLIMIIENSGLTREMIPTEWLKEPDIWAALLKTMPMTAMVRNLGNMGKVGLLIPGNLDAIEKVCSKLSDAEAIKQSRIHPLNVLSALNIYASGHGFRGSGTWEVVGDVIDALNDAFYKSFDNVEPSGKRICIGLDVSGSMNGGQINGIPGMTPRVGASAMCMVTYQAEPKVSVMAFCDQFIPINMSRYRRLDDLVSYTNSLRFGGTDCALPMLWAMKQHDMNESVVYDAFVIYTDNETWAGSIHPIQALNQYRRQVNPDARLVIVGMTANDVTIGDPQDAGVLDVVGFDTAAPDLISKFIGGAL